MSESKLSNRAESIDDLRTGSFENESVAAGDCNIMDCVLQNT
jgi:hypothetical protein